MAEEDFDDFGFGFEEQNATEQLEDGENLDNSDFGFDGFEEALPEQPETVAQATPPPPQVSAKDATPVQPAVQTTSEDGPTEYDGDPNVKPICRAPREDITQRTHDSVFLVWDSFDGQVLNSLKMQIMPSRVGFDQGYDEKYGKEVIIRPPKQKRTVAIKRLKPNTSYVFRLVAANEAGATITDATEPITTCHYAPQRGDKSAWFNVLPNKMSKVKTLGRKLSIRKLKFVRYWIVLDGALLTWFKDVDGKEVGYCHLGKLKEISYPQREDNSGFTLIYGEKDQLQVEAMSNHPTVTDKDVFEDWVQTITAVRKRLGGNSTQVVHKTVEKE